MTEGYLNAYPNRRKDKFIEFIDFASKGKTNASIAKRAGLCAEAPSRWRRGVKGPSVYALEAWLNACGYELTIRKIENE